MRFLQRAPLELATIILGLVVVGLGFLQPNSILIMILGSAITVIAIVTFVDDLRAHYGAREEFRKKLVDDALRTMNYLIVSNSLPPLPSATWTTKTEEVKRDLLGGSDYIFWNQFYDHVGDSDKYCGSGRDLDKEIVAKLHRAIFDSFLAAYDGISWIRDSVPRVRISDFRERAKQSVTL